MCVTGCAGCWRQWGCAALAGTIIQLERHKCFLPKVEQKKKKKKKRSLDVSKFGTNESNETAQLDLWETASGCHCREWPACVFNSCNPIQLSLWLSSRFYVIAFFPPPTSFKVVCIFSTWPAQMCYLSVCVTSFSLISANKHLNWTIFSDLPEVTQLWWECEQKLKRQPHSVLEHYSSFQYWLSLQIISNIQWHVCLRSRSGHIISFFLIRSLVLLNHALVLLNHSLVLLNHALFYS